jgi:hypothetical protein
MNNLNEIIEMVDSRLSDDEIIRDIFETNKSEYDRKE